MPTCSLRLISWPLGALWLVFAAALLTTGVWAGTASASFPGANGRLVYSTSADIPNCEGGDCRRGRLFILEPRRGTTTEFAAPCAEQVCLDSAPAWSPDGRLLAFDRFMSGSGRELLVRLDGSVFTSFVGHPPTFSPSGRELIVGAGAEGTPQSTGTDVVVTTLTGDPVRRLTFRGGGGPRWSVRGVVVFSRTRSRLSSPDLYTVPAAGGRSRRLTYRRGFDPDWSPDGRRLAFVREYRTPQGYDRSEVVLMNVRTRRVRRFTQRGGRSPVWSPDGKSVAFLRRNQVVIAPLDRRRPLRSYRVRGTYNGANGLDWQPLPG